MVIYLDIILALNILFNFFILLLTNYFTKSGQTYIRLICGALFASGIIMTELFATHPFFHSLLFKVLYSLMIILCTFGYDGFYMLMKRLGMLYFITFTTGGGLLSIQYIGKEMSTLNDDLLLYTQNVYGENISLVLLCIGFPFMLYFMKGRMDRHVKDKMKYDQMYKVHVELDGICKETVGYIDSGNQLKDPLTNTPVIVCDQEFLSQFFSSVEWEEITHALTLDQMDLLPTSIQRRLYIVPYQGVGESSGLLYTFKPDKLTVYYDNQQLETTKVLVGIQLKSLTIDGSYHCLLHPELIQLRMTKSA